MKNIDSESLTTGKSSCHDFLNKHKDESSYIKIASKLVDEIGNQIYGEIERGDLAIDDYEVPLQMKQRQKTKQKSYAIELNLIDAEEHKSMMKKFIRQHSQQAEQRRIRTLQNEQKERKRQQSEQKSIDEMRSRSLEQRRKQIQKRLEQKKQIMSQISKSIKESNKELTSVKKRKFLYQAKQQEFQTKFILPRLQEQKYFLEKKKSLMMPLDIDEIREHERKCELMRSKQQKMRKMKIQMDKSIVNEYNPPTFVPQAFKMVEEEQFIREKQQELRRKKFELNQIRKKQFLKEIQEIQRKQRRIFWQRSRTNSLSQPKSEEKAPKMERQGIKKLGDYYLREILTSKKKISDTRKLKLGNSQFSKSQRNINNIEETEQSRILRAAELQKLRAKKISHVIKSEQLDPQTKYQRLKSEIKRLDKKVSTILKQDEDPEASNVAALALVRSIHAKIAYLNFALS